jgi:hypothetical protein
MDCRGAEQRGPVAPVTFWPPRVPEEVVPRRLDLVKGESDDGGVLEVGEVWATRPCRVSPWCWSCSIWLWNCPIWLWSCAMC